ncbi:MAG: hypothetical protein ACYC7D_01140 [Nitrososphaerales archaeon]
MSNQWERYFSRHVGLSRSLGDASYEIVVIGKDEIGALAKIVSILSDHKVNLSINNGYLDEDTKKYIQVLFCDFTNADCNVEEIESELRSLKFVVEARSTSMKGSYHDQYLFPIVNMQSKRVLFMMMDSMIKIERSMIERMGSAGAVIMFQEGKDYAIENIEQMNKILPQLDQDSRLKFAEDSLRTNGWGIFKFSKIPSGFQVLIKNPPILVDSGVSESRFLIGVTAGILEKVCGGEFAHESSTYEKKKDILTIVMKHLDPLPRKNTM